MPLAPFWLATALCPAYQMPSDLIKQFFVNMNLKLNEHKIDTHFANLVDRCTSPKMKGFSFSPSKLFVIGYPFWMKNLFSNCKSVSNLLTPPPGPRYTHTFTHNFIRCRLIRHFIKMEGHLK